MSTKIKLTSKQKQHLLKIKRTHKSNLIRDRAHAVLLRNQGLTLKNTAQAVLRSEDFIKQSIKRFKQGELEQTALSGNNSKLSTEKRKVIIEMIRTKCPKDLKDFKYATQFWSTDILKAVIKKNMGLSLKQTEVTTIYLNKLVFLLKSQLLRILDKILKRLNNLKER